MPFPFDNYAFFNTFDLALFEAITVGFTCDSLVVTLECSPEYQKGFISVPTKKLLPHIEGVGFQSAPHNRIKEKMGPVRRTHSPPNQTFDCELNRSPTCASIWDATAPRLSLMDLTNQRV